MAWRDPVASASSRQDLLNSRQSNNMSPDGSRAAAIGRKRRAPQNNFAGGDKRAKLDNDVISISDDEDDHRRSSIESGEVATSASGSSHDNNITLEEINSGNLRRQIKNYVQRENVSIHEAICRHAEKASGMPFAKDARFFLRNWNGPEASKGDKEVPSTSAVEQTEAIAISDDEGGVSVGESPAATDYGALARRAATGEEHTADDIIYLADLDYDDQVLQTRYFGIIDPADTVRCLGCGKQGHMQALCPASTCKHCDGKHFSHNCPTNRKCRRCRQRGHEAGSCSNRPVYGGGLNDKCDYCSETGHVEEECSSLWRTYHSERDPEPVKRIFSAEMRKACYNCASSLHWGDDCPRLPGFARDMPKSGVWSGERAGRFVRDVLQGDTLRDGGSASWKAVNQHPNSYQLAQFDD